MADIFFCCNSSNDVGVPTPWSFNNPTFDTSAFNTPVELRDENNALSGISLQTVLFNDESSNSGVASVGASQANWEDVDIFRKWWETLSGAVGSLRLSGFAAGQGVNLRVAATQASARNYEFSATGATNVTYVNDGDSIPTEPVLLEAVADGNGEVLLTCTSLTIGRPILSGIQITPLAVPDSVTPDADTFYGDTLNYTTTLTGVTSATLTDSQGNVLALTSVTDTSASVPAIVAGLAGILVENDVTLTLSDGTNTAVNTTNFIAPTGQTLTTLTSIVDRDLIESDWIFGFDEPAVVGDQSLENSALATHNADGSADFTSSGSYSFFTIQASTGDVSEITKTIEADSGGGDTPQYAKPLNKLLNRSLVRSLVR